MRGGLGGSGAVDTYRFTLSEPRTVGLGLPWMERNADLYLEDAHGLTLRAGERGGSAAEWIKTALPAGTYDVRVEARAAGANEYLFSYEVAAPRRQAAPEPTPEQAEAPPARPTGLTVAAVTHDTVTLTWDDPQDDTISGYRVSRRAPDGGGAGGFILIASDTGSAAATYTDTGVQPETRYAYRVHAISPQGVSEPSSDLTVETAAAPSTETVNSDAEGLSAILVGGGEENERREKEAPPGTLPQQGSLDDLGIWYTQQGAEALGGFLRLEEEASGNLYGQNVINRMGGQRDKDAFLFYLGSDDAPLDSDYLLTVEGLAAPQLSVESFYDLTGLDAYIAAFDGLDADFIDFPRSGSGDPNPDLSDADAGRLRSVTPRPVGTVLATSAARQSHLIFNPGAEDLGAYLAFVRSRDRDAGGDYRLMLRQHARVGETVRGTLDDVTDTDTFAVLLEAGKTYQIEVMGSDGLPDPILTFDGDPEEDAYLVYSETTTQVHYVSVSGGSGTYTLSVIDVTDVVGQLVRVSFGAASYTVAEGSSVTVTVTLSADPQRRVEIPIAVTANGAGTGDYSVTGTPVIFDSGQTSASFTVRALDDNDDDDGESLTLSFPTPLPEGVSTGTPASATVNLEDDDGGAPVEVTAGFGQASYSVAEGGSVTVTVTLSADPERTVTIPITKANQDDASNSDYSGVPADVTFNNGDTEKSFTFIAAADDIDDDGESVALGFGANLPDGVTAGTTATVTITNDDTAGVTVSKTALSIDEGATGTYTVVLDSQPTANVTVTVGGAAADVSVEPTTPLTFTASTWNTEQTVTVSAAEDDDAASDAAVTLTHTVSGSGEYSGVMAGSVTVDYATSDGTATGGQDYTDTSGTLTFAANSTASRTISVPVTDDAVDEAEAETFTLTLSNAQGASLAGGASTLAVTGTITDNDDPAVTVDFEQASYSVAEGGSVTVTVTLSADPERTVTIPITKANQDDASNSDYSGVPDDVTFNNGDTEKSFTFTAAADDIDDDGESVALGFGTNLPDGVTAGTTATVTITNDDTAGVTVSKTALSIDEGATGTYTVVLDSQPTANVTVTVGGAAADVSVDPTTPLTFTASTWNTEQTVTVSAAEDDDAASDAVVTLTHTVSGTGEYSGVTAGSVTVTIVEKDASVLSVSDAEAAEDGGNVVFTVRISAASGSSVTVDYATSGGTATEGQDYTDTSGTLTFAANSTASRTISVPVTDDAVDEAEAETFTLTLSNAQGASLAGGASTLAVTGTITDNDDPAVTVEFGAATYTATEGGTVEVTVTLSADPEREVTVLLTHDPQGGASSDDYSGVPADVTFNNGDTEKSFTFIAAADDIDDDGESVALGFGTNLPDGVTAGTTATVTITNDDTAGVTVSKTALSIDEGATGTYTVVLDSQPTANVTVTVGGAAADVSVEPTTPLTFTASTWNTEQTVTVSAAEDDDAASDAVVTLTHTVSGTGEYSGVTAGSVTVTIVEKDASVLSVSDAEAAEDGGNVVFTVRISAASGSSVTVDYATSDGTATEGQDYTDTSGTLTFAANSTASRTISVPVTDDAVDEAEAETFTLTLSNAQGASLAGGASTLAVTGTITDNDDPAVTVEFDAASYTATEGGTAATVTVNLSADPERSVTIPITATGAGGAGSGDYSLSATTVTIAGGSTSATFTVTATDDSDDDDGESVNLSFGTNLPDAVSAGTQATATVSLTDNDVPQVTVEFGAATYTATEGGTAATVTVNLNADPERTVIIPITAAGADGAGSGDYSLSATSVTIAGGSTSATFTVTATDDSVDDDGESVSLAFGTNLPDAVSAGTQATASVSLTDNDVPQVTVEFGAASYTATEGGTAATVTVNLSADPERTVIIPITATGADGAGSGDYSLSATSVTIAGGSTSATFTVTATDDSDNDDGESVNLSFGTNLPDAVSAGTQATATVSLTDNDVPQVTVEFGAASYTATEGGTAATVTVNLSADPERTVIIPITATGADGATSGDYSLSATSVTIDSGETSATFTVTATDDSDNDDGESVNLSFGTNLPDAVSAGTQATATVNLTETDSTRPGFSSAKVSTDGTKIEIVFDEDLGATGSAPAVSAFDVTVDGGTAVNPSNVALSGDTVTLTMSPAIAAGASVSVAYDEPTSNALADAASNEVADFTEAATNRPAAPVVTLTAGNEKLTATWAAPANGGSAITAYDVEWKTAAQTWAQAATAGQSDTAAADATGYEITGLTNDTAYTVRVRAGNDAGDGPWSAEASETPVGGDTTAPAVESATVSTDGTAIDIVFDEALDRTGSAPAASAFGVTVGGGTAVNPTSVAFKSGDADTITLTMASADTIAAGATVSVAYDKPTSNALADAASNEVADFTEAATNRPAAPVVTLTAGNEKLTAAWTAPANGGSAITGYDVEWKTAAQTWEEAATAGQSDTAAADATAHEITGLTNDTEYTVRVRAGNDAGDGPWSTEASETPNPAAPGKPQNVQLVFEKTTSGYDAKLSWDAPDDLGGGTLQRYSWLLTKSTDGGNLVIGSDTMQETAPTADSPIRESLSSALSPPEIGDVYRLTVTVWNESASASAARSAIFVLGETGVPEVTQAAMRSDGLLLAWRAPEIASSLDVTGYQARYKLTSAADVDASWTTVAVGATSPYTITGLADSAGYNVRMRAVIEWNSGAYYGDWSEAKRADNPWIVAGGVTVTSLPESKLDGVAFYGRGETLEFTVEFNEAVTVTGEPEFEFCLGAADASCTEGEDPPARRRAAYSSDDGTDKLVFSYVVGLNATDLDTDGIRIGDSAIRLGADENIVSADTETAAHLGHAALGIQTGHKVDDSHEVDTTAPSVSSAKVSEDGMTILIVFDQELDSSSTVAVGEFALTEGAALPRKPSGAALSGTDTVTLTMTPAIAAGETVSVAYTAPATGGLQDTSNNKVAGFTESVINRPAKPTGLTLTAGHEKLTASWTAPTATGGSAITRYDVEWKTAAQTWEEAATAGQSATAAADATTHEITGLTNGTEYTVRVRAVNGAGNGPWSTEASETPAVPANKNADLADLQVEGVTVAGFDKDTLSYEVVVVLPRASLVTIETSTVNDQARVRYSPVGTDASVASPGFQVSLLHKTPTTYTITVTSADGSVTKAYAIEITRYTLPGAPRRLDARASYRQVELSWNDPDNSDIDSYQYRVSGDGGNTWDPDWTEIDGSDASTTGLTLTGLDDLTAYTFEVRAVVQGTAGAAAPETTTTLSEAASNTLPT